MRDDDISRRAFRFRLGAPAALLAVMIALHSVAGEEAGPPPAREEAKAPAVTWELLWRVRTGSMPKRVALTPDGKVLVTCMGNGASVSIVDLDQGELIATIPDLGKAPCGLALAADGKTLYVTSWYSNELRAIKIIRPD
jgi:hypothetical protein